MKILFHNLVSNSGHCVWNTDKMSSIDTMHLYQLPQGNIPPVADGSKRRRQSDNGYSTFRPHNAGAIKIVHIAPWLHGQNKKYF